MFDLDPGTSTSCVSSCAEMLECPEDDNFFKHFDIEVTERVDGIGPYLS